MKSISWGKPGNMNLKGKKSKSIMAGKYIEDVIQNFTEKEKIKWEERLGEEEIDEL